jgi:hypothetical protein
MLYTLSCAPPLLSVSIVVSLTLTEESRFHIFIPAKAGINLFQGVLDPGVRRGDGLKDFLRSR